jgi:hypothetical protein
VSSHIEWLNANQVQVSAVAHPGEFSNDDAENDVACIVLASNFSGDGVCIQGRPDDLIALAKRITLAAFDLDETTAADPKLRSLYGMV